MESKVVQAGNTFSYGKGNMKFSEENWKRLKHDMGQSQLRRPLTENNVLLLGKSTSPKPAESKKV